MGVPGSGPAVFGGNRLREQPPIIIDGDDKSGGGGNGANNGLVGGIVNPPMISPPELGRGEHSPITPPSLPPSPPPMISPPEYDGEPKSGENNGEPTRDIIGNPQIEPPINKPPIDNEERKKIRMF